MRLKFLLSLCPMIIFGMVFSPALRADDSDPRQILREGLIGTEASTAGNDALADTAATTATVSTEEAMSGTQEAPAQPAPVITRERWKNALEDAGLRVTDTSLVDMMSGEKIANVQQVDQMTPRDAYADGYMQGYRNGYKSGYTEGYKDGIKDASGK